MMLSSSTHPEWAPHFDELVPCHTGKECVFVIQAHDIRGQVSSQAGASFKVRLVGDTMFAGSVRDLGNGTYLASYIGRERPGASCSKSSWG